MSRLYWHSPSRTVELYGAEYHHLNQVAMGPAEAAWGFTGADGFDRAGAIVDLMPEVDDGEFGANYVHTYLRRARDLGGEHVDQFMRALRTRLRVEGVPLIVAGIELKSTNIELNTALAVGPDSVRLAAKIGYWGEIHAWVDGPDREWLAGLIDEGLATGVYRHGLWYVDRPSSNPEAEPDRKWSDLGWSTVAEFLRERDDEPVVLSYSVCDRFPNADAAGWEPPPMPDGWLPTWADTEKGVAEWLAGYPEIEDRRECYQDYAADQWYEIPEAEQWSSAMDGLRKSKPWARLAPETLSFYTFHYGVTVEDLFAPDRDDRVRAYLAGDSDEPLP